MNDTLEGPSILSAIKAGGVEVVVSVPDIVTSEGLLRPLSTDPDLRHIRVCEEDEGVSICAALSYRGVRALLMMQQTGMTDEIVVPLYQAAFEWHAIKPWPLTWYAFGAMGRGSSPGLGFAIGVPERRVWVLDGDGSLLMNLGTLVTIAEAAPENLVHFVFENGTYEANGAHPIPGAGVVSFAGIARAAGIPNVHEFSDLDALAEALPGILIAPGPTFVDLKVVPGGRYEDRRRAPEAARGTVCFAIWCAGRWRDPGTPWNRSSPTRGRTPPAITPTASRSSFEHPERDTHLGRGVPRPGAVGRHAHERRGHVLRHSARSSIAPLPKQTAS